MPKNNVSTRNPFEALTILAVRKQWCWNIGCTTCGNRDFRVSLWEMTTKSLSPDWWYADRIESHRNRSEPSTPDWTWPLPEQRKLIERAAAARLQEIALRAERTTGWLGYVGLALLAARDVESEERLFTKAWVPQLMDMARPQEATRRWFDNPEFVLSWQSLASLVPPMDEFHRHYRTPIPITEDDPLPALSGAARTGGARPNGQGPTPRRPS
jgi:hypothetical protein